MQTCRHADMQHMQTCRHAHMQHMHTCTRAHVGTCTGASCDCVLTLRNTADVSDERARAKVNGLVAGPSGRISWANRFHMNLNPHVITGR